jgi:hypothetical protein
MKTKTLEQIDYCARSDLWDAAFNRAWKWYFNPRVHPYAETIKAEMFARQQALLVTQQME